MKLFRHRIQKENTTVMIELHHDDGALYAIIERIFIAKPSNPRKERFVQSLADLLHARRKRPRGKKHQESLNRLEKKLLLLGWHTSRFDAFRGYDAVVLKCSAKVSLL